MKRKRKAPERLSPGGGEVGRAPQPPTPVPATYFLAAVDAARRGDTKLFSALARAIGGAVPSDDVVVKTTVTAGTTMLHLAAQAGDVKLLRLAPVKALPIDTKRLTDEATPLVVAAQHGHHAFVKALLARGADPNVVFVNRMRNRNAYESCLHTAAVHGHVDVMTLLIKHGANINFQRRTVETGARRGSRTMSILYVLASIIDRDFTAEIKLLLEAGVDPDVGMTVPRRETPLLISSSSGNAAVVQVLLQHGADPNIVRDTFKGHLSNASPLFFAAQRNHYDAAKLLLDAGADPNIPNAQTNTPLHMASAAGYHRLVNLLCEYGANVYAEYESDGATPLHDAVGSRKYKTVLGLVKANADPMAHRRMGGVTRTVVGYAHNQNMAKAVLLLDSRPSM